MQEKLFDILFEKEDVTWQSMLYDLVRKENMDPWDIDIKILGERFLEMLKVMKEMDFRISGKIILAAAIMLKLKSDRLVGADMNKLDSLFAQKDEDDLDLLDELEEGLGGDIKGQEKPDIGALIPRTPQPRKRKVSIYDLVHALEQAVEVKKRHVWRSIPEGKIDVPENKFDLNAVLKDLYGNITSFFSNNSSKLTFSQLVPDDTKEAKVHTFIPLLHLTNQRKIDISQEQHFGDIFIEPFNIKKELDKQL